MCKECERLLREALEAVAVQVEAVIRCPADDTISGEHWELCAKYRLAAQKAWEARRVHYGERRCSEILQSLPS